jgi:hypothetical protein
LLVFAFADAEAFDDPKPNEGMLDMNGIEGMDGIDGIEGMDMPPMLVGIDMPPMPGPPVTSGTGIVPAT